MRKSRASRKVRLSHPDRYDPMAMPSASSSLASLQTYTSKVYGPVGMARHKEAVEERHVSNLASLGKSTRALLTELRSSSTIKPSDGPVGDLEDVPMEDGFQDDNDGDVWVDITDEGQDDDVVQMRDVLSLQYPSNLSPQG
ncbi:hypothetical protein NUW54_g14571 [Trametes sanguinea]|uniref:Uncharacterized protein n=1 Tax=Trametes sanguinea TaxID=158606 RepID=A0ACC1MBG4_9APHY|nr:hypothetical protein NUW54_g14571 [Trametes sanguinea]